jgi:hypothetical protein
VGLPNVKVKKWVKGKASNHLTTSSYASIVNVVAASVMSAVVARIARRVLARIAWMALSRIWVCKAVFIKLMVLHSV